MNILVIEDDEDFLDSILDHLHDNDHVTSVAQDGTEGSKMIKERGTEFDLILSDIRMPGPSGLDLLQEANQYASSTPFVIMTGHGDVKAAVKAIRNNVMDFMIKPFTADDLDDLLDKIDRRKSLSGSGEMPIEFVQELKLSIPTSMSAAHSAFAQMGVLCADIGPTFGITSPALLLVFEEGITNAIVRGNLEVAYNKNGSLIEEERLIQQRLTEAPYKDRKVEVIYRVTNDAIQISITDEGQGHDGGKTMPDEGDPGVLSSVDRGLLVLRNYMDVVSWENEGRTLVMTKKKPS